MSIIASDIRARIIALIDEDPDTILVQLGELNKKRSHLKMLYDTYSERRKAVLSWIMEKERLKDSKLSDKKLEAFAHANKDYTEFLKNCQKEIEDYHLIDHEYWTLKARFDYLLTMISFAKSEAYLTK